MFLLKTYINTLLNNLSLKNYNLLSSNILSLTSKIKFRHLSSIWACIFTNKELCFYKKLYFHIHIFFMWTVLKIAGREEQWMYPYLQHNTALHERAKLRKLLLISEWRAYFNVSPSMMRARSFSLVIWVPRASQCRVMACCVAYNKGGGGNHFIFLILNINERPSESRW